MQKKPLLHTWVVFCVASSKSSVQVTRFPSVSFQPSVALQTPPWGEIMVMMTVMMRRMIFLQRVFQATKS